MRSLHPFWLSHDRIWITDRQKDTLMLAKNEKKHWLPYQGPRDVLALILNIPKTFKILRLEKPDIIISTGASIAINFAFIAKFLGIRFIYIESISRDKELSLSGRLVYLICDEFYVQWPELCQKYPKAVFKGYAS